jgi:predicted ABC-type ATPase
MPNLYVIAGCNGAGKTTASYTILPELLNCKQFVNADEIARGLSPFEPETVAIEAGRIMLARVKELTAKQQDFAFETTLATRSYVPFISKAQKCGYIVTLVYFWLNSPELAISRVRERFEKGGHSVPEDTIRRRYIKGLENFIGLYMPISDAWILIDNSRKNNSRIIARNTQKSTEIIDKILYNQIVNIHE